jgi:hypothetical protein
MNANFFLSIIDSFFSLLIWYQISMFSMKIMPTLPFCNITLKKYIELIITALSAVIETTDRNQDGASKTGMSGIYLIHAYLGINALIIALLGCFTGFLLILIKADNLFDITTTIFVFSFSIILIKTYSTGDVTLFLNDESKENGKEENIISSKFYRWYIVDDIFGSTLIQVLPFSVGIVFVTYLNL